MTLLQQRNATPLLVRTVTIFKPLQFEPSFNTLFTASTSAQLLAAHGSIDGEGKKTLKSA
ncbi:hypothetical protein ACT4WG_12615 [Acinetobacter baumannii]|nr:hypothetical protein [Acinetobacter baumannii]